MIDPAAFLVGGDNLIRAVGARRHDLPVIAAGDDAAVVRGARQNRAAVNGDTLLAIVVHEQQVLLAKHEDRCWPKEMHPDERAIGTDRADTIGKGRNWRAGVAHVRPRRPRSPGGFCPRADYGR